MIIKATNTWFQSFRIIKKKRYLQIKLLSFVQKSTLLINIDESSISSVLKSNY